MSFSLSLLYFCEDTLHQMSATETLTRSQHILRLSVRFIFSIHSEWIHCISAVHFSSSFCFENTDSVVSHHLLNKFKLFILPSFCPSFFAHSSDSFMMLLNVCLFWKNKIVWIPENGISSRFFGFIFIHSKIHCNNVLVNGLVCMCSNWITSTQANDQTKKEWRKTKCDEHQLFFLLIVFMLERTLRGWAC